MINLNRNQIYKKIYKTWAEFKHHPRFLLFLIFAISIFTKLLYFHGNLFSLRDFITSPQHTTLLLFPKIAISLFISSFLFVTRRSWWTIPFSFIIDIWIIANIIYYRACEFFINTYALQMIDNMHGFWDSITIFFTWKEFIPILITLLYILYVIKLNKNQTRNFYYFIALLFLALFMRMTANYYNNEVYIKDYIVRNEKIDANGIYNIIRPIIDPHYLSYRAARNYFNHALFTNWEKNYIIQNSIIDFFGADISYYICSKYYTNKINKFKHTAPIGISEQKVIDNLIIEENSRSAPQTNLVIILFESLESWIFENFEGSEFVAPNLKKLISKQNTLYASHVKSQAKQGNSGDGQMIVLTGILPLEVGAACRLYGNNSYPNYAHFFNTSITINPAPGYWNQREVNPNYGISQLIEFSGNDDLVIDSIIAQGANAEGPFFLLGITTASHSPFNCDNVTKLTFSDSIPKTLQKYLSCINYTDRALGRLISKIEEDPHWKNTTLVITGDHIVFKEQMLDRFVNYPAIAKTSLKEKRNYVPLIIYSPLITSKITKNDIYYQSDIYPTIINLIGTSSYYWKGIGEDILSKSNSNRLDEETGYKISDIIIRNNYFKKYEKFNK